MPLFYSDQPVFGFDIGRSSIKLMQIDPPHGKKAKTVVRAYGNIGFNPKALDKGLIIEPEIIVKAAYELLSKTLVGTLSTKHVAMSLPNSHSFSRMITLPLDMKKDEIDAAVQAEITQSIPVPITDMYYDFVATTSMQGDVQEVQIVASPSKIVSSYIEVIEALGLVPAVVEPNINSVTRMVVQSEAHDGVSLIIDLGSEASDLSVYDSKVIRATGTVDCGGDNITKAIAKGLGVSPQQAHNVKTRYGLEVSKKQASILQAIDPELGKLVGEIKKVMRYYAERADQDKQIDQIVILGGGANLPGLSSYITDKTRIPARLNSPWNHLEFGGLQPPHELETTIYTTAGGLSLITPEEIAL